MMSDITPDWFHLMPYGYAPGSYMNRCMHCTNVVAELDKRAVSCRPCAAKVHEIARLREVVESAAAADEFYDSPGAIQRLATMARAALKTATATP